jgi:hypothetical protein
MVTPASCAPHLKFHIQELGGGLLGFEFKGNSPTGMMVGIACTLLDAQGVRFDHHAINLVGIFLAAGFPIGTKGNDLINALAELALGIGLRDFKAQLCQFLEHFVMGLELRLAFPIAQLIDKSL